jgi:hypothetical protein
MKRVSKTLACVAGASLCIAQTAWASADVDAELAEMRELVQGLQQKVDAQQEQLAHQGEMLEDAQQAVSDSGDGDSLSGLAAFIDSLEVDGHVSGSYFFNWNQPDLSGPKPILGLPAGAGPFILSGFGGAGGNMGTSGAFYPYHGDHNSFTLDQVWFGLGKPATAESRAGFRFDLIFGNTASMAGTGVARAGLDGVSDIYVHQAYVEYLAPVLEDGINVKAGKFSTLVGAEVVNTTQNFNITRGNIFNLFQPIDHVGFLADTEVAGVVLAAGLVNSGNLFGGGGGTTGNQPDGNKLKSFIGQVGYTMDMATVTGTVIYGGDAPGNNSSKRGLLDVAAWFDPMDNVSIWANFDYSWNEGLRVNSLPFGQAINTGDSRAYGLAVAGRVGVTEDVGLSLRGEYAIDRSNHFGLLGAANSEIFGVTFTADYQLVENLMVRAEARWDRVNERLGISTITGATLGNQEFLYENNKFKRDQFTTGVEVVYTF